MRCPHCQQPIDARPKRVCFDCGKPIGGHHRWTLQPRGTDSINTPVHRICKHPTMLVLPSEWRREHGDELADRVGIPRED
jgi:hypothetical protein